MTEGGPPFDKGTVWLIGAGPGDPRLLTLLALDGLRQADVVVYDALVSPPVLKFVSPQTRLEFAGKRGGRPSHSQQDISSRLIDLAGQGLRVVRLKGGDPFMFGRGGEEVRALAEAGVRFRVVPGVTAGLGGLAYAGIPATLREINQGLLFVTGHPAADGEDRIDWEAVARLGQPVVIYMGLTHLSHIVERLLAGGLAPATPLAILIRATLPDQEVIELTLGAAASYVRADSNAPALIVIGWTVAERRVWLPSQLVQA